MTSLAARLQERDLVEYYFEQPWSDDRPAVPPTGQRVAAVLALTDGRFNPNGIQATTHVVSPLIVVTGPRVRKIAENEETSISDDPQGILDSIAAALSTIASHGWTRDDVRRYLWFNGTNDWDDVSYVNRYAPAGGHTHNRNLSTWHPRESGRPVPTAFTPDDIRLFVAGGAAGRFSAFLPAWSTATTPVLRAIDDSVVSSSAGYDLDCSDGACRL